MKPAEIKRALEIVEEALELNGEQLDSYLDDVCGSNSPLRREVLSYLDYDVKQTVLDGGPSEGATPEIPHSTTFEARYELGAEIARGGMGVILRAHDRNLGRDVAVKVLTEEWQGNTEIVRRFLQEAQIGGQLQHPGIAPFYEIGRLSDQRPFIAMKLVKGQTFADLLVPGRNVENDQAKLLGIFAKVCQAIAFAHSRGVIHRDLKPANVMVGEFGEVQVMDWGLAKLIGGENPADPVDATPGAGPAAISDDVTTNDVAHQTRVGQAMGTPAYMPPEQSIGRADKASDVFSLGAILCEILTGQPTTGDEKAAQDRLDRCAGDRELVALARDCIQRGPADRPQDAGIVAAKISTHIDAVQLRLKEAEIVTARAEVKAEEERKRRQRTHLAVAVGAVALALAALVGWGIRNSVVEQQHATRAEGLVAQLLSAEIAQVPRILDDLQDYREWADPLLRQELEQATPGSAERLHAMLGLLPVDDSQLEELREQLLVVSPNQFEVVRQRLSPYQDRIVAPLWDIANDEQQTAQRRFQAACALALYTPEDARWEQIGSFVANFLVNVKPSDLPPWGNALRPVGAKLLPSLSEIYRNKDEREQVRSFATDTIVDYAADEPEILFNLLADAEQFQFSLVFDQVKLHQARSVELALAELKRPLSLNDTNDQPVKRIANAAVALLRMGQEQDVWPLLKHNPDPRVRSYLIHWLSPRGVDVANIVRRINDETEVSIRQALLLSLGEFDESRLPLAERERIVSELVEMYKNHSDPGLHGAARWLLKRWQQDELIAEADRQLQVNEQQLRSRPETDQRRWYVTTQGPTFVILDADEFAMGAPAWEESEPEAKHHRRRIGRQVAVATTEITSEQFARCRRDRPHVPNLEVSQWMRTEDSPRLGVTWFAAAEFCNWLSEKEGVPESQWCYEPNDKDKFGPGMKARDDYLELSGYRLPTEAEWEFACRGDTVTSRCFGWSDELLGSYAWYMGNSSNRAWPVASLKPNDFGLFDMHGNANEWCHESKRPYRVNPRPARDVIDVAPVGVQVSRTVRGGAFMSLPIFARSAYRTSAGPSYATINGGFRPVRTMTGD